MLNAVVSAFDIGGVCIALTAFVILRQVAATVRTRGLRLAWCGLIAVMLACVALLLAATVGSWRRTPDMSDVLDSGIHVLGPSFVLGVAWLSRATTREALRLGTLEQIAFLDPLTGLANRRRFEERLAEEVRRACQLGSPLSLIALDIDHFKRINDTRGHSAGDLALRQVAAVIAAGTGRSDTICRIGGDEFVVLAPGLTSPAAAATAERLRQEIATTPIVPGAAMQTSITVSVGLATLLAGEDAAALLRRADEALYSSKHDGRDRVSMAA